MNQSHLHTVDREDFTAGSGGRESRGEGLVILNKCSHPLIDLFVVVSGFLLTGPLRSRHSCPLF